MVCAKCRPDLWNGKTARADLIEWVAAAVKAAKSAYYAGYPTMRDEEYDALETTLRAYAPEHPILQKVGADTCKMSNPQSKRAQSTTSKPRKV